MEQHPVQGGVELLLVTSCYRNWEKLQPDGPLGSYGDFIVPFFFFSFTDSSSHIIYINFFSWV